MKLCCQIWHSRGLKCPECTQPEVTVLSPEAQNQLETDDAICALQGIGQQCDSLAKKFPTYSDLFKSLARQAFDTASDIYVSAN